MKIVVAPGRFKGTLSAERAAEAIAEGARRVFADANVETVPVSDGGEGFVDALVAGVGGTIETAPVSGPLGERVEGRYGVLSDGRIVMEAAAACGLTLVPEDRRDPSLTTSRGLGELIAAATTGVPREVEALVGVGDTATNDGGAGMAAALGWRLLDGAGRDRIRSGGDLVRLARIERGDVLGESRFSFVGACDVDVPLLGPEGAVRLFSAQKGATPEQMEMLERGLGVLAGRIRADLGMDVAGLSGAGAGGGLGAGLAAFVGAELRSGFGVVAEATGLEALVATADLVVTGEGSFDEQSLRGKAPGQVVRMARAARVGAVVIAGRIEIPDRDGRGIVARASPDSGDADAAHAVCEAAQAALASLA